MKRYGTLYIICMVILLFSSNSFLISAQTKNWNPKIWFDKTAGEGESDFEALKGEAIEGKAGEDIKKYNLKQTRKFKDINGALVSTIRNGEILKVSLPANLLFNPNESVLNRDAQQSLLPVKFVVQTGYYDMIITSHTDNTGSSKYLRNISEQRADAVYNWFITNGIAKNKLNVFSYTDEQPLYDNDSMQNRLRNRRITLYFIPNKEMVKKAKRQKLNK